MFAFTAMLRRQHHSLGISNLTNVKRHYMDTLSLARKRLLLRIQHVQENRTFLLNLWAFLRAEKHTRNDPLPPVADVQCFWQDLYEKVEPFNADASWIEPFKSFCNHYIKEEAHPLCPLITPECVRAALKWKINFSAPGSDGNNNLVENVPFASFPHRTQLSSDPGREPANPSMASRG